MSVGGKITLLPGQSPAEEFAALAHEVAQEMMHREERRTTTTKRVRETEAEAVALSFAVQLASKRGSAAQDYIGLYGGDAKLLTRASNTSSGPQLKFSTLSARMIHPRLPPDSDRPIPSLGPSFWERALPVP